MHNEKTWLLKIVKNGVICFCKWTLRILTYFIYIFIIYYTFRRKTRDKVDISQNAIENSWAIKEQPWSNRCSSGFPSPLLHLHTLWLINNINKSPTVFHYLSAGFLKLIFLMCLIGNKVPLERAKTSETYRLCAVKGSSRRSRPGRAPPRWVCSSRKPS